MRLLRSAVVLACLGLVPSLLAAQSRPRPQYQCGDQPSLDSVSTAGSRWLACNHNYWSSVYRAAKMLNRYSGIDANCLQQYSEVYEEVARKFMAGEWAAANQAKANLTCAAGRQVRIDSEAISLLCTDSRWTLENAGFLTCPDPMAQHEAVHITGWSEEVQNGYTLMVRNNSPVRTVRLTEWTVYDCVNIKGAICGRHTRPVILRPGQSTDLGRIEKDAPMGGFQYRWNWAAEFVE